MKNQRSKIKNQKLFLAIFLFFLFFSLIPSQSQSAGLVPCGGCAKYDEKTGECLAKEPPCTFCDFFALIDNIIDFILFKLILPIAALMFIIGGFFMLTASGNPELFGRAKSILTATVIGIVIIFVAFIFIGTFFQYIGLADWTKDIYQNWWQEGLFEFSCH